MSGPLKHVWTFILFCVGVLDFYTCAMPWRAARTVFLFASERQHHQSSWHMYNASCCRNIAPWCMMNKTKLKWSSNRLSIKWNRLWPTAKNDNRRRAACRVLQMICVLVRAFYETWWAELAAGSALEVLDGSRWDRRHLQSISSSTLPWFDWSVLLHI